MTKAVNRGGGKWEKGEVRQRFNITNQSTQGGQMSTQSLRKRLEGISKCSINGERVRDLCKLLVNKPEIWELAYANISSNDGATTTGIDGVTAD